MIEDSFFRSMSLVEDLDQPERFSHYKPTRRAAPVIAAVLEPGASTMVIAPYGSGKSLAAGIAGLSVRNGVGDRAVLHPLIPSIMTIAPALGADMKARSEAEQNGLVVVLSGHVADPLAAIAQAIGMARTPQTVEGFGKALREGGWDHVAIVWDEFGRHLQGLVGDGRPTELDLIQRLAERCARSTAPTMSLTLLLHQNLLAYASRLNDTTRSEWRKVEGRFAVVRMIEDSQEIYELIAQVVEGLRPGEREETIADGLASRVREARWLDDMADVSAISKVLADAQPLTAGALQILPTLVARIGQNERSLFSFLREVDLKQTVGIEEVYKAFADALRSDVGVGGTYRRWLETESARSRAASALGREVLAAACLLQLGTSGERRRLPRSVLELAVLRPGVSEEEVSGAIDDLLEGNLLLWRRHNDDVAVWHGADIDVSLRVKEERERQSISFDLQSFLDDRFPAPNLRTPGHNARFGVNRFFRGSYVPAAACKGEPQEAEGPSVQYVLARSREDIETATAVAKQPSDAHRILVIPHRAVEVESAAVEVLALEALKADRKFLDSDPMVSTELDELLSVAFEQLAALMRALLDPRASAADWWVGGEKLHVSGEQPASMAASALLDAWYEDTPRIANEQLMRESASRTMQTARVRVVGAILERHNRERLGYEKDERSAEGSIYRTILERSGLHRPDGSGWRFVDPDEVADKGLRKAWSEIAHFLMTPTGPRGKPLAGLLTRLSGPPFGVPRAMLPLLIAGGYKRFARTVAIYLDGVYLPDLLGFQFDQLVMAPEGVVVRVAKPEIRLINFLRELCYTFAHEYPGVDDELFRSAFDAIARWRAGVPEGSKRTQKLDGPSKMLLRAIDASKDPVDLLLQGIPAAFGFDEPDITMIARLDRARTSIDGLADAFALEAMGAVEEAFRAGRAKGTLLAAVKGWASCFDETAMDGRGDLRISDKAVLRKAIETANGRFSPKSFAGTLSSILLQRPLEKWDDRTAVQFRAALRETRERIETAALDTSSPTQQLRPIIAARMEDLKSLLARLDDLPEQPGIEMRNLGAAR